MPYVEINGVETYYETHGEGQPIIFLHGGTSDQQLWGQQVEMLKDEYRIITYDIRDHGKTESSPVGYTVTDLSNDLNVLIDALAVDHPVICGLSLGGMIALQHAVEYPEAATGYVVVGTYLPERYTVGERLLRGWVTYGYMKLIKVFGYNRTHDIVDRITMTLVDDENNPDDTTVEQLREMPVEFTDAEAIRIFEAVQSWTQTSIDLTEITVPVMGLFGEHEPDWIKTHIGQMSADIPDFRAYELPNAGHNSHIDAPDAFVTHVREFVDEAIPTSSTA